MSKVLAEYRPDSLSDFVGFDREKDRLNCNIDALSSAIRRAIETDSSAGISRSFKRLKVASPHVLIYGVPGSGKTTLGEIYALEMLRRAKDEGWPMCQQSGTTTMDEWTATGSPPRSEADRFRYVRLDASHIRSYDDLDRYIYFLQAYGVILIDEIHNLKPLMQEKMYQLLHDGYWESAFSGHLEQRMGFTIVGTTTNQSKLKAPMRARFETQIELVEYDDRELEAIVHLASEKVGLQISAKGRASLLSRSQGTPRDVVRIVNSLARLSEASRISANAPIGPDAIVLAAEYINLGPGGLEPTHVRILRYLADSDRPVSARTLADATGVGSISNLEEWEVFLKVKRYIAINRGRIITEAGRQILRLHR